MTNEITLHHISVSEMDNNCYLLAADGEGLLIDAADDAPAILAMAEKAGVKITKVLTTHRHWDHVRALEEVLAATGAKHYAAFLESPALPSPVDVELQHDDTIEFGGRNHSTVVYGISKVEKNLAKDAHQRAIVEDIIKNCRQ